MWPFVVQVKEMSFLCGPILLTLVQRAYIPGIALAGGTSVAFSSKTVPISMWFGICWLSACCCFAACFIFPIFPECHGVLVLVQCSRGTFGSPGHTFNSGTSITEFFSFHVNHVNQCTACRSLVCEKENIISISWSQVVIHLPSEDSPQTAIQGIDQDDFIKSCDRSIL